MERDKTIIIIDSSIMMPIQNWELYRAGLKVNGFFGKPIGNLFGIDVFINESLPKHTFAIVEKPWKSHICSIN